MRSISSALAVSMRIGICIVAGSLLRNLQTSSPDISGSMRSSTIRAGMISRALLKAATPSWTLTTLKPACLRLDETNSRTSALIISNKYLVIRLASNWYSARCSHENADVISSWHAMTCRSPRCYERRDNQMNASVTTRFRLLHYHDKNGGFVTMRRFAVTTGHSSVPQLRRVRKKESQFKWLCGKAAATRIGRH